MAGVAQRSKLPVLAPVFFGAPPKQVFNDLGARKMFDAAECFKKTIVAHMD
jgi:hypothetical protein